MTPQAVIAHFGTQQAAGSALGVSQGAIAQWVAAGRVPALRQWQIQLATGGALQADRPPVIANA